MAKKLAGKLKLQVPAGRAQPGAPVGPALGQRGLNIMEFCKAFNAQTEGVEPGAPCPTLITYYQDKSFTITVKTPAASWFLKQAAGVESGSQTPGREAIASVTVEQVRSIAEAKLADLNTGNIDEAMKIVLGSARSMGIEVKG
ncbi:MAG: 50S ribosomal protein L11 [Rhodobacteraceae bacterium]|nr:50S ribosomal protein L11 [Paracoccaceae bacterium]